MKWKFFRLGMGVFLFACQAQARLMMTSVVPPTSFNGTVPSSELVLGGDGLLYGVSPYGGVLGNGCLFKISTNSGMVSTVAFDGTNGAGPSSSLLQTAGGNLFGLATVGGVFNAGTLYQIGTNGILSSFYSFDMANASGPAALIIGTDGNFYGVTGHGGNGFNGTSYTGNGVVFRVTTNGVFTRLASFNDPNGFPNSIVEANDGNFYGTTLQGGANGLGTVFRVTPEGILSTLATFGGTNGAYPISLMRGSDGLLYGCTTHGGNNFTGGSTGWGTVYRVTTNGDFSVLWAFSNTDGSEPKCRLLEVTNGLFYGTAHVGGRNGSGNVFQISTNANFASVLEFDNSQAKGGNPWTGLTKGADGNLYGVNSAPGYSVYCLRPEAPPVLQRSVQAGQISFSWNAWGGLDYQLLYKTNLVAGNWQLLAGISSPTNTVGSYSESIDRNAPRFYTLRINILENWW
jgi:uncharacterized repeat protein (TIGR03803 family)